MAKDEAKQRREHSPLPWSQHCFLIKSAKGDHVTHTGMGNLPPSRSSESEANAEFIVRAANNYDALVEALEALEPYLTDEAAMLDYASLNEGRASGFDTASIKARRALSIARQHRKHAE